MSKTKQDFDNQQIDITSQKAIYSDQKLQLSADCTSQGTFGDPVPDDRFSFNLPTHFITQEPPVVDQSNFQSHSFQDQDKENQMIEQLTRNLEEMKISA